MEGKTNFTKSLSRHRNYAFILYVMTAIVDLICIMYYGSTFSSLLIFANALLLFFNGCCGVWGTLSMQIIPIFCNIMFVCIIMITYLVLILMTFLVAED
jgi:hypothetical protein